MPVEHGFRPRPFGQVNLSPDGVGGSSGKGKNDTPFQLLPGKIPLGEQIERRRPGARRRPEQAKPTIGEEINAYLDERARLRAEGQLPTIEGKPPIITSADAISVDLHALLFSLQTQTVEQRAKYDSVARISWGVDALAFGKMSHPMQEDVTVRYEFTQGFNRNHTWVLEDKGRLNGEETAILAEQLAKVGLPFTPRPEGITIPFAPTVATMREIAGGEPLWKIPAPGEKYPIILTATANREAF